MSKSELAALHLSSLLSALIVAMTVIPVFGLTRRLKDSATGWRAAVLMITVPAIGIFVPRSDVLYPCTGMMLAWATVTALLAEGRLERWVSSLLAGLALFCCLLLSLAHLPVVVMLGLFAFGYTSLDLRKRFGKFVETTAVTSSVFVLLCGIFLFITDCNLLHVWRMNLSNHSGFYSHFVRTWSAWFLVNPIEFAMSVGLPMACVASTTIVQVSRHIVAAGWKSLTNGQLFLAASTLTWALLWLSGKNMGEAARLWCFVTPWVAIAAAQMWWTESEANRRDWLMVIISQLVVATFTVGRVSGFLEF